MLKSTKVQIMSRFQIVTTHNENGLSNRLSIALKPVLIPIILHINAERLNSDANPSAPSLVSAIRDDPKQNMKSSVAAPPMTRDQIIFFFRLGESPPVSEAMHFGQI